MTPRDFDRENRLPSFSLNRRITVLVMGLTLAVVGVVAFLNIPAEMFPRGYTEPFLWVGVPWTDAPAREVMDKVTIPLEEEFGTIRGIDRVTSVSMTGMSRVFIQFKQGTDMDVAYREVRDRIERARVRFPADIDRTFINKDDVSGFPIYAIGIAIDEDQVRNAYDLIHNEVMLALERVDGVASISTFGLEEKEILIEVDRERAAASGLNIYQLAQDLGDDNFTMASGTVHSGSQKLLMRSMATYRSLDELENRLVGQSVRLRDVAKITYEEPDKEYRARVNSKPAVALHVLKESEKNTREVCRSLDAAFERLQLNPRLKGLDMQVFFGQGEVIDEQLSTLGTSGMIGGLIALVVLFVFMRRIRLTLIVVLSIPISLLIGVTVMYFWGESLNILSLVGLMVCIGLLVDNSVVVAENIHRLHRQGMSRRDACIQGAGEVGLAITMSTLTTIVVFLPAALVEGPAQFFLLRLAIPIAVSVAGSLIIALVFIPLSVYLTLPNKPESKQPSGWRRLHLRVNDLLRVGYDQTFGRLNRGYNTLLAASIGRRFDLVLGLVLVFAVTQAVTDFEFVGQQDDEQSQFQIQVEMPKNSTLEETEEFFKQAEKIIEAHKEEFGLEGWFVFHRKSFGEMQAWFDPDRASNVTAKEATKIVADELPKRAGLEVYTGNDREGDEGESGTHGLFVRGENPDQVDEVVEQLEQLLIKVDGVMGQKKNADTQPSQLGLVVDREKAQRLGANPQVIAGVVGYALRGTALPKYHDNGKEIPVRVRFQEEDRESLTELANFQVPTDSGTMLPISALTHSKFMPSPDYIVRRDKMVGRSITFELEEGREEETRARLISLQASLDLPEGVSFGGNQRQQQEDEDLEGLQFAMVLSIVFIYLLMGFLFESFILPLSIILTIPLSIIGVRWAHFFTGRDVDFLGFVAIIVLIGVVVNNGIVLIDYVNRLRSQGRAREDALLTATHLRFRPIMMTAITTIGGMVPLALAGASSIGLSYTSFALTLIGGMTTATLLTLLVVPIFYTLFDDLRIVSGKHYRNLMSRKSDPNKMDGRLISETQ